MKWSEIRQRGSDDDEASSFLDALENWLASREARVVFWRGGVIIESLGSRVRSGFESMEPGTRWPLWRVRETLFEVLMRAINDFEKGEDG